METSDHRVQGSGSRRYLALAQELLSSIIQGHYEQGGRLPSDREIAARSGVSRPTAREAFLALELIGAIEVRHGDGVYVRGPHARVGGVQGSPLDAPPRELIETRSLLEPVVAGLAARRIHTEHLRAISRDLDEAAELVGEPAQLPRFVFLGLRFHADLAPECGNGMLADIVRQLVDVEQHPLWVLVNQQAMSSQQARESQIVEHREVVEAIAAGDPKQAERAMGSHLNLLHEAIFFPSGEDHMPIEQSPGDAWHSRSSAM